MHRQQSIKIAIYYPKTPDRQLELSRQVAVIHADAVLTRLKALHCPEAQQLALLDAVIATAKANASSRI